MHSRLSLKSSLRASALAVSLSLVACGGTPDAQSLLTRGDAMIDCELQPMALACQPDCDLTGTCPTQNGCAIGHVPVYISVSNGSTTGFNDSVSVTDEYGSVVYSNTLYVGPMSGTSVSASACVAPGSTVTFSSSGPWTQTYSGIVGTKGVGCSAKYYLCRDCEDKSGCYPSN